MLQRIYDYIDAHFNEMIEELGEVCRYRSVWGDEEGLEQTRTYFKEKLGELGGVVREHPVTGGNALLTTQMGSGDESILFYNHYDVVEEGDVEKWISHDPFQLHIADGKLYARGVSDNKGALMSRIHGIRAVLSVLDQLPLTVKFLVEGDEESSSPSMKAYFKEHPESFRDATKANVCIWENGSIDTKGRPWVRFGVRSNCSFDLRVTTANTDTHGRMGATIPSASWRLIWALASLKGPDEKICIDGFYDDVIPLTDGDHQVLDAFPYDEEGIKERLGIGQYLLGATGNALKERVYSEPSLSICGLEAGEMYKGIRGIVPHTAHARISFYLVADQNGAQVEKLLRRHLDRHGFSDVEIESHGRGRAVRTNVDIPFRYRLEQVMEGVYRKPMVVELTQLGSGPANILRDAWPQLPIVGFGPANNLSNHHAPNENIGVEDYRLAVKQVAALICSYL